MLPFWDRPEALGDPVGRFPSKRCNDGALYAAKSNPCPEIGENGWLVLDLEYTVSCSRLQQRRGQLAGALRTVDEILLILGDRQIGGVDDPLLVYAICVQVLRSTADPRADALARLGCQHLLHQGATHPDSPLSMRVRQWLGCT